MTDYCKGAELVIETAASLGVDVCFANPGTTEMALVAALDKGEAVRPVLCLFEGVCTGAADGYGRMTGRPALTLLHLGPGFANGIANLHNARRAYSPIVNLVGDHASWHLAYDAPLTSDIHSLANPVSGWVKTSASAGDLSADVKAAITAALGTPGCSATLILPTDFQEAEVARGPVSLPAEAVRTIDTDNLRQVVETLQSGGRCILLLGGTALGEEGQRSAAAIADHTGAEVLVETYPARIERGGELPAFPRLPYFPEDVMETVAGATIILVGAREPVAYFGYEGMPSQLVDADRLITLSSVAEDSVGALRRLAEVLEAPAWQPSDRQAGDTAIEPGKLSGQSIAAIVAGLMPENSIVVPEGSTCSIAFYNAAANGPRHTLLTNTGGAIGQGPALSIGCAIACPDRKVINLQSDGSALYTIQSLWTQARERLDVVTLIVSNQRYAILQVELKRSGQEAPGPKARALTELNDPAIDWVALGTGFGVPSTRAETTGELEIQLRRALSSRGPHLIEMVV